MGNIHGVGGSPRRGLMLRAFVTSVLLSILFIVVYGSTNWLTAQRPSSQIGTWYFEWELTVIPYVPLLIVPYMSMDLFFFFATFLCRNERAINVFAKRVMFAIVVAAAFFLLLPLRLAWPTRPPVDGWFGTFVEQSCNAPFLMEYPHNLFPTLHIALCMIVANVYSPHTRPLVRFLLQVWFILIALSTVLTWQHHVVDVAGGVILGGFAFYFFREHEPHPAGMTNMRVGCYYAVGALIVLAITPLIWPWGVFLLWPAASLGIMAAGYFGLGPGITRKTNGQLMLSSRFVLAPILVGQYLSLVYYRQQCRAWDEVIPGVLVGRVLSSKEAKLAIKQGVTAVLDLTAEFSESAAFRALNYRNIPILDLTAPTPSQLDQAVACISEQAKTGTIYVHCKIGYSRSAAIVGAYLMAIREVNSADEAVEKLRQWRPTIIIRPEAMAVLRRFEISQREFAAV